MAQKLNEKALGYAVAIISAAFMVLIGGLSRMGYYAGANQMMMQWHMYYTNTLFGTFAGAIEAAIIGFVAGYAFAWVYNKFA